MSLKKWHERYRKLEQDLEKARKELSIQSASLREANTALKVLLKQRENDRAEIEEKILSNVETLIMPYIDELKKTCSGAEGADIINILESNLKEIISPFSSRLSSEYFKLTPRQIMIAGLIREGKQSKDIANILNLSFETVNCHRQQIRKKLGLNNSKVNLRSFLLSLSSE